MPIIESKLNPRSDEFRANAAALDALVADLRDKVQRLALGGERLRLGLQPLDLARLRAGSLGDQLVSVSCPA